MKHQSRRPQGYFPSQRQSVQILEIDLVALTHETKVECSDFGSEPNQPVLDAVESQPDTGIGSTTWRQETARKAANAKHDQPGGSREKHRQIREMWATGKYSTRDRCAEEEYGALRMSLSSARNALKNTPNPEKSLAGAKQPLAPA